MFKPLPTTSFPHTPSVVFPDFGGFIASGFLKSLFGFAMGDAASPTQHIFTCIKLSWLLWGYFGFIELRGWGEYLDDAETQKIFISFISFEGNFVMFIVVITITIIRTGN